MLVRLNLHTMNSTEEKAPNPPGEPAELPTALGGSHEIDAVQILGYRPELRRNRSMFTLLFQSLAIAAVSPWHRMSSTQNPSR